MRGLQNIAMLLLLPAIVSQSGCDVMRRLRGLSSPPANDVRAQEKEWSFRRSSYVFIADFDVDQKLPLFDSLVSLRERVYRQLKLPESNRLIKVYLFKHKKKFRQYIKAKWPQLPERRAFFIADSRPFGGEDLQVFTYWGDQVAEDLHHELTHALLHSVLLDVPRWLDEGLAEYFEIPGAWGSIHRQHLEKLHATGKTALKPNLLRLEKATDLEQMGAAEYREAWAWIHFMLHGDARARRVLLEYLRDLQRTDKPGSLATRLHKAAPNLDRALVNHIARLKQKSSKSSAGS